MGSTLPFLMYIRESVFAEIVGKVVFSKCIQNIDSMWSETVDFDLGGVEGHKHFQTTFFLRLRTFNVFYYFCTKNLLFIIFTDRDSTPPPFADISTNISFCLYNTAGFLIVKRSIIAGNVLHKLFCLIPLVTAVPLYACIYAYKPLDKYNITTFILPEYSGSNRGYLYCYSSSSCEWKHRNMLVCTGHIINIFFLSRILQFCTPG